MQGYFWPQLTQNYNRKYFCSTLSCLGKEHRLCPKKYGPKVPIKAYHYHSNNELSGSKRNLSHGLPDTQLNTRLIFHVHWESFTGILNWLGRIIRVMAKPRQAVNGVHDIIPVSQSGCRQVYWFYRWLLAILYEKTWHPFHKDAIFSEQGSSLTTPKCKIPREIFIPYCVNNLLRKN